MNARFLFFTNDQFPKDRKEIANHSADAGIIPKIMKKATFLLLLMLFSLSGVFAQIPGGPVTTAGTHIQPVGPYPVNVSLPVKVTDFNNISAISLMLEYDPAVLELTNVSFNSAVSSPTLGIDNSAGTVTIGWINNSGVISLSDESTLLTLNFSYKGGSSLVSFISPYGFECEYTDGSDYYAGSIYNPGFVTDLNAQATYNNSCDPGNVGIIEITASGGSGVYEYSIDNGTSWFGHSAAPYSPYSFTGLAPGVYNVMVRDMASSLPLVTLPVTMLTPPVHNVTQDTYFCYIQEAIDDANNGDEIEVVVFPWIFLENIIVNKSVSITGNTGSPADAVIDGGGTGSVVTITSDNVVFNGFTITNSGTAVGDAGIYMDDVADVTIQNNVITNNENGFIVSGSFNTGNTISENTIAGNTTMGMLLDLTDPFERVNVPMNYWGDADGPYNPIHNTCGAGDEVSDKVIFHPWYIDDTYTLTATLPFHNITMDTYYCTIQDAADHADDNDIIHAVVAGTYEGLNYNYNKTITVINNTLGGVVEFTNLASTTVSPLIVSDGHVKFDGFNFSTADDVPTVGVSAGKLTLRNNNVYESSAFDQIGVVVTGGEIDAGTSVLDFGHNRFLALGQGKAMDNNGGIVNAICNHWGSILYPQIFPLITGVVEFDPWSDYNFTMCDVLTLKNGPVTYAPKIVTSPGAVVVPITVDGFRNVDAISLTMHYDPAIIEYTGFTPNTEFSSGMYVNIPTPGIVKISWQSTTIVPYLADGSLIVDLHYDFLGGTSLLLWDDTYPVYCEYQNGLVQYPYNDDPQHLFYSDGWITDLGASAVASTNVVCKGTDSGTITINGSTGGSGSYEYSVDGGLTWQPANIFNVYAGTYDVWIRDANYPVVKIQLDPAVVISEPAVALSATANWTKRVRCKGESNGEALVTPIGGWGGYTYLWSDANGQTTQNATGLPAGTYTVTVTDAGGCEVVATTKVIEPINPFSATVSSTVVSCKGGSNGTITVNAQDGWGYYMYSIDHINYFNYLTSNVITGLPAGNYVVHVFDDERCELFLPITVQEPVDPLTATVVETKPVSCYGFSDGEILATPTGGWGGYEISFDDVNYTPYTTGAYIGFAAGAGTLYLKDAQGCVVAIPFEVTEPAPFTAEIKQDINSCYNAFETISVEIIGGNPPYNISITDGTNTITQTNFAGNLFNHTQQYTNTTVWSWGTITDANNCPAVTSGSATITVNPLPEVELSFTSKVTPGATFSYCYDEEVVITLSDIIVGTPPFNFEFEIGSAPYTAVGVNLNDQIFKGKLAAGTYTVEFTEIKDANGCTPTTYAPFTSTVVVHEEPGISFGFNGIEAGHNPTFTYCYDETIGVTLYKIYGGDAPFSVTYEVNGVTSTVSGLNLGDDIVASQLFAPGTYSIVVTELTDNNGCKASSTWLNIATATVIVNEEPVANLGFNGIEGGKTNTVHFCYDEDIEVTLLKVYGGAAPFSITIDGLGTFNGLGEGSIVIPTTSYAPGVYPFIVTDLTDANGCKADAATLTALSAYLYIHEEPAVQFSFNGNVALTGSTFEYCANELIEVSISKAWGGIAPFTVEWTIDGTPATATLVNLNDPFFAGFMSPGTYTVNITSIVDAYGCSPSDYSPYVTYVVVNDVPALGFAFNENLAVTNSVFEYCFDDVIEVTLDKIWGGLPPFVVQWTVDGTPASATVSNIDDVLFSGTFAPGNHTVQITSIVDDNGCSPSDYTPYVATVIVHTEPIIGFSFNGSLAAQGSVFNFCYDENIEVVLSDVWGGEGPFDIAWSIDGVPASSTIADLNDILFSSMFPVGSYNVEVTSIIDKNGCSPADYSIYQATVIVNPEPAIEFALNGTPVAGGSSYTFCFHDIIEATIHTIWAGNAPFDIVYTVDNGSVTSTYSSTGVPLNGTLFQGKYNPGTYNVQIISITDATGCLMSDYSQYKITVEVQGEALEGYFVYNNIYDTELNNLTVSLVQNGVVMDNTVTDINGYYKFSAVCPGTFEVHVTTIKPIEGSINSTDAVNANKWGNNPSPIEKVEFLAADVNNSGLVNITDALYIVNHFLNDGKPPFNFTPEWVFWPAGDMIASNNFTDEYPTITMGLVPMYVDFYGLVKGDFDRSFLPDNSKIGSSVTLTNNGSITGESGNEVVIPVTTLNSIDFTAISLIMQYPADKIEVTSINMAHDNSPVGFSTYNGELRIAYFNNVPVNVSADGVVFNLRVKLLPGFAKGESAKFYLTSNSLNEFAGADYAKLAMVKLKLATIENTVGIDDALSSTIESFTCYPNPFTSGTRIAYSLAERGNVVVNIYDVVGRVKHSVSQGELSAGTHEVLVNGSDLAPGVYFVTLNVVGSEGETSKTIRIVRN